MTVDAVFHALGDPTRRKLLERLSEGPQSVSQLAGAFTISLAAIAQHVQVLEQTHLIRTEKVGRIRTCTLAPEGLETAAHWIQDRRRVVERRLDRLGALLADEESAPESEGGR